MRSRCKLVAAVSVFRVIFAFVIVAAVALARDARGEPQPFEKGERFETISGRSGSKVPFILIEPDRPPIGSVILFAGGNGKLALSAEGIGGGANNFMVRTRRRFVEAGFVTAVIDAPPDRKKGLAGFRTTEQHAEDVAQLIAWLTQKWNLPVALIGTSRGTISVANAAVRRPSPAVRALILSSSVTTGRKESLADVHVEALRVPTLVVHHELDACKTSPFEGAGRLMKRLEGVDKKRFEKVAGGSEPRSKPCAPLSYHGFFGQDAEVTGKMISWLKGVL
jgi:hypothetical protein